MGKYLYNPKDQNLCKKYESDIGTIFFPLEIGDTVFAIYREVETCSNGKILPFSNEPLVVTRRSYLSIQEIKYTVENSKFIETSFDIECFKSFHQANKCLKLYQECGNSSEKLNSLIKKLILDRKEKYYGSELFWGKN